MSASALGASQAIQYLPAGSMVDYAGTSAPAGWLMCDGRSLPTSTYPDLFAAIGYSYGGSGANFNLPDYRGRFARYNDNMGTTAGAASRDTGRVHGSAQGQATAKNGLAVSISNTDLSHAHYARQVSGPTTQPNAGIGTTNWSAVSTGSNDSSHTTSGATSNMNHGHGATMSGDTETRPINLSSNRIIKY